MTTTDDLPSTANGRLYDRPVLIIDARMHTAIIKRLDADREGRFLVTASEDKTARVWDGATGDCLHTLRLPAGPGNVGKANAAAISPDGALVAAAGWTLLGNHPVYLFDRSSGELLHQVDGSQEVIHHLTFSPDGSMLVACLGHRYGIRLIDLTPEPKSARIVQEDEKYGDQSTGAAFDAAGRIAATGLDGGVRLYDRKLRLLHVVGVPGHGPPRGIAFSPDGRWLAVGCGLPTELGWPPELHVFQVLKHKGRLRYQFSADPRGLLPGSFQTVAWSADGDVLYAGGSCGINLDEMAIRSWSDEGRGAPQDEPLAQNSIVGIRPLPRGRLAFAAADPRLGVRGPDGREVWSKAPVTNDFREHATLLAVSADGERVHFRKDRWNQSTRVWDKGDALLSVRNLRLTAEARPQDLAPPRMEAPGLVVEGWFAGYGPTLNGKPLPLERELREHGRSLAIAPNGACLVLGTEWWLRMLDREGKERWQRAVPAAVCAVNITGDGRLVVAACEDGTIRWYRADDGIELLSFLSLADRTTWVLWTPDGFHAASPEAHGVLRWHLNRGRDEAPESIPISDIPGLRRPDALPLVLEELDVVRVVGVRGLVEARQAVQRRTNSSVPPGAQLHVIAIGVSTYNETLAGHLQLRFAHCDAEDLASVLHDTQHGLYARVTCQRLCNSDATKVGILHALQVVRDHMAQGTGQDLAVVLFSGHGGIIGDKLFLLPHEVDARTSVGIKAYGLSIDELRREVLGLAMCGRVLVLIDACRSGAAALDGTLVEPDATALRSQVGAANVMVLTSSSGTERSREDPIWSNGAFTEAVLEALSGAADANHDGLISAGELLEYVVGRVPTLTDHRQKPGVYALFGGNLFVVTL